MDTEHTLAQMRTERPETGGGVPAWDCISRDRLRAWIADMRSRAGHEDQYDAALNDLEESFSTLYVGPNRKRELEGA